MARNNFAVLDCETGGFKEDENPITQIAISIIEPTKFAILEKYETFIKPYEGLIITTSAINASKVSMSEINEGMDYKNVLADMIKLFQRHTSKGSNPQRPIIVGHNTQFDIRFIKKLFSYGSKELFDFVDPFFYDTLRMIKDYETNVKGSNNLVNKLEIVCARYGIELKGAHGAAQDVEATQAIFTLLMKRFRGTKGEKTTITKQEEIIKSRKFFELP